MYEDENLENKQRGPFELGDAHEEERTPEPPAGGNPVFGESSGMEPKESGGRNADRPNRSRGMMIFVMGLCIGAILSTGVFAFSLFRNRGVNMETEVTTTEESDGDTSTSQSASEDASGDVVDEASVSDVFDEAVLEKINTLLTMFNTYYYDGMDISDMQDGVLKGLTEGLGDAYTTYYTQEEYEELSESTSGTYDGVGAVLTKNDGEAYVTITYVYSDSPAEEAGIEAGDLVTAVDGVEIEATDDASYVASKIRGETGTEVVLTIYRDSKSKDYTLVRDEVDIETVSSTMLDDGVGYIQVVQFSSNTSVQFEDALEELNEQGMTSLIIDVRDNGGGVLDVCAQMLDDLLPEGTVVYTEDKQGNRQDYTSDEETQLDIPMVLLINGNSASASEIFAAALADYDWATLVGTTTYGKGVYQSIFALNDGSAIKITIGKFYSPKGNNFNEVGIEPDVELEYENTAGEDADYSMETDNQLQKAIEVLTAE
ncbi:MAG: S41 family peptidase [Eubacterium sp.]|nr:S41 family peptidase [Eubacterium sp.]